MECGDACVYNIGGSWLPPREPPKVDENLLHEPFLKAQGLFRDISFHLDKNE